VEQRHALLREPPAQRTVVRLEQRGELGHRVERLHAERARFALASADRRLLRNLLELPSPVAQVEQDLRTVESDKSRRTRRTAPYRRLRGGLRVALAVRASADARRARISRRKQATANPHSL